MTHEGRMARGADKLSKGIEDSETAYYLANNKPKVEVKEVNSKKTKGAK